MMEKIQINSVLLKLYTILSSKDEIKFASAYIAQIF